ncbi:MAG: DUF3018 family protein [Burkholderiaceae bacterium]|nr:DUF3018 family protein [Burkholderiaceae bacterium]
MPTTQKQRSNVAVSRERMRLAGLRPVQFWVPDTRLPAFAAEVREQCLRLKGDAAEEEVLQMTEAAASLVEGWK